MALEPKQIEAICTGLSSGHSLRAISRELGIAESTVRYALKADPEAFAQTARARDLGCDALADECIEISDNANLDPADRRVRIETRLKLIGKWSQRYGEKIDHTLTGADGGAVQIAHADVSDLAKSLRNLAAGKVIEGTVAQALTAPAPRIAPPADGAGEDLL